MFQSIRKIGSLGNPATARCFSALTIYGFPLSQPTRSVLLLCKQNNIDYDFVLVDALKGENRKPEWKKILPAGLVPSIKKGDFSLGESAAILQYIAESNKLDKWYPTSPEDRAKVNFWLHWNNSNTRSGTKGVLVYALFPQLAKDEKVTAQGKKDFTRSIAFMETHLKESNTPFLVGQDPTIADLQILTELDQLSPQAFDLFDFSKYPHVLAWMQATANVLGSTYDDVFKGVTDAASNFSKK